MLFRSGKENGNLGKCGTHLSCMRGICDDCGGIVTASQQYNRNGTVRAESKYIFLRGVPATGKSGSCGHDHRLLREHWVFAIHTGGNTQSGENGIGLWRVGGASVYFGYPPGQQDNSHWKHSGMGYNPVPERCKKISREKRKKRLTNQSRYANICKLSARAGSGP